MKMVDKKAGQKLNIVDRKFRMTPKMTVKVTAKMTPKMTAKMTPKMTPKRQRMILKAKEMTFKSKG